MKEKWKDYIYHLRQQERSIATCRQYQRDILQFLHYAGGESITREQVLAYKERLRQNKGKTKSCCCSWRRSAERAYGYRNCAISQRRQSDRGSGHSAQGENPRDSAVR